MLKSKSVQTKNWTRPLPRVSIDWALIEHDLSISLEHMLKLSITFERRLSIGWAWIEHPLSISWAGSKYLNELLSTAWAYAQSMLNMQIMYAHFEHMLTLSILGVLILSICSISAQSVLTLSTGWAQSEHKLSTNWASWVDLCSNWAQALYHWGWELEWSFSFLRSF